MPGKKKTSDPALVPEATQPPLKLVTIEETSLTVTRTEAILMQGTGRIVVTHLIVPVDLSMVDLHPDTNYPDR